MTLDPVFVFVARLVIGVLFLGASVHKLRDLSGFGAVLAAYGLPERAVFGVSVLIVALEVTAGVGVLIGAAFGSLIAGCLLLGYAAAMGTNLLRGRRLLDCGCSINRQPVSWPLVVRNVGILPVVFIAAAHPALRPLGALDYACIVAGALVVALLYGAVNEIMAARMRLEEWV